MNDHLLETDIGQQIVKLALKVAHEREMTVPDVFAELLDDIKTMPASQVTYALYGWRLHEHA